jgi:hypothetical protein
MLTELETPWIRISALSLLIKVMWKACQAIEFSGMWSSHACKVHWGI